MVRGWDRVIQFRTTDTGQGFTMRVENQQLSELDTGPVEGLPDVIVTGTARTSATCSGATSTRRRST